MTEISSPKKYRFPFRFFIPLLILIVFFVVFLKYGPLGVFRLNAPPIEKIFIERVRFSPEQIHIEIFNDGPQAVKIAQLTVNEVFWNFQMVPQNRTLQPLERADISVFYPWIEGEPLQLKLIANDGVTFEKDIDIAFTTPTFNTLYLQSFILLGLYVGVIPVLLGLLWFPFLKKLRSQGYMFLLALTVGLLVFLGFDAMAESFELFESVPNALNASGIFLIGFLLAIFILSAVSHKTAYHRQKFGEYFQAIFFGYLIALGIGLHNLGEGLAIGSAYAIGEVALGATLVIGFMIHNVTEGIAIVAPITRIVAHHRATVFHLIGMGALAGLPTILGTLIGGFSYSPSLALFFLAIGSGAIFDVSFDILEQMKKDSFLTLFTLTNVLGFLSGLLVMYTTGFFVFG